MKKHLQHRIFSVIAEEAEAMNQQAFVIGGYVRDIFLKRESKDIDIVVLGSGIDLAQHVAKTLGDNVTVNIFRNFGTAMIKFDGLEIEFVGARKESYRLDSRKPIVEEGTLEDDQKRRDFTINAMAIHLTKSNFGELLDPFNGVSDLENKIIRTPLDADITFSDDPLRMMRAIRFASQLHFQIDKAAIESITKNCERIKIVSGERISEELNKIILSSKPSIGFDLLFKTGLLQIIFPQMCLLHGVEYINGQGHKDNFYHTLQVLDNVAKSSDDLWLRWAAILHDIAKPATKRFEPGQGWTFHGHEDKGARMVKNIFRQLKLPLNEKMKFVEKLVQLHLRPIVLAQEHVTDSAIRRLLFDAGDDIDSLMILCHADVTTKNDYKIKKYKENFRIVTEKLKEVEEKDRIRNWQPPITGEHIMETFNISPGKEVGIIKNAIREAILEGEIRNDYNEAFELMLKISKDLGLERRKMTS
ncbi:MAG: HD domain-containing protein [Bacteroidetes bacterium]|nr:HD domain-containing protein [Bacteroidota bacterium]MBK9412529.1 HD domain-containing protein [Bacteroidota bacterium]MBL0032160.1 HD domain-containing protein [Bacteroidota bacterium]MBP6427010.1 HD domain-containing protein [Bacteroidia bacterium]MBP6657557.1 HD domain-containing protein [Bacteroidia bacterium]